MAKIVEEILVVKLSKLVKNEANDSLDSIAEDLSNSLEPVIQELIGGDSIVVEIERVPQ
jgi:tetrahydromethanopterin S-methyltransferase subunit B